MVYCRVLPEAHSHCATLYVTGFLADDAAARSEELVGALRTCGDRLSAPTAATGTRL